MRTALTVGAFDWSLVPAQVTIHIIRGHNSDATQGQIWLDADLLDAGDFSWGIVQHEYAHEVDFVLLADAKRAALAAQLGGQAWWPTTTTSISHGDLTCERFASTLA